MAIRVKGLDPIVGEEPKVLILGTFPGESSRKNKQYYFDERNRFWSIINRVLNDNQGFVSYTAKTKCLKDHHVAVWDTYESKVFTGESSNEGISDPTFNDIRSFLQSYPSIRRIVFNGLSESAYEFVRIMNGIPRDACVYLRQTSGRVQSRGQEDINAWKKALCLDSNQRADCHLV